LAGVTTRVTELWDRPRYRRSFILLAVVVLAAGLWVNRRQAPASQVYPATAANPFHQTDLTARYGPRIKLPDEVRTDAKRFVQTAILRSNPAAAWEMVAPGVRAGLTRAQWAGGAIPVPQFPRADFGGAGYNVVRSRARDVLMDVAVLSKRPSVVQSMETLLEFRPAAGGGWLITYAAVKGQSPPLPAAQ
jgi:hypothetical protein